MKDYQNDNAAFSSTIKILETTDDNHADNINVTTKQLLDNTVSNKKALDVTNRNLASHGHNYLPLSGGTVAGSLGVTGNVTAYGGVVNIGDGSVQIKRTDLNNAPGLAIYADEVGYVIYSCMNSLIPRKNGMNLGSESTNGRIGNIYTKNGTLTGSDRHIKENIKDLAGADKYMELFDAIRMVSYTRKNEELTGKEIYQKSPNCRSHIGIIAQEVEDVVESQGMTSDDFAGVTSVFCYYYGNLDGFIAGGYQAKAEGKDYSGNTYNWKHREDKGSPYEIYNEVIEKDIEDFKICDYRKKVQYIMIEDNSKLTKEQPPVTVRGIYFIDHDGNVQKIPLDGRTIPYYDADDKEFTDPLSESSYDKNEDTLTVNFKKMYGALFMEIPVMDLDQYEKVVIDMDYVSEYKVYLLPAPEKEAGYQNANVWDRARNDQILYDYTFNYNELFSLAAYALQETRREFKSYRETTDNAVAALEDRIREMEEKLERMVDSDEQHNEQQ